ncbi:SUMF1/EgtB/PvdO family nonheme iron enzyme [Sorangium sp. So ce134]
MAAAGGNKQREYPWSNPASSMTIDGAFAVYDCTREGSSSDACAFIGIQPVGSRSPKGDGNWGQADLAGNVWEWVMDWYASPYHHSKCSDCAHKDSGSGRVLRGGGWVDTGPGLLSSHRNSSDPSNLYTDVGARCARTP